MLSDHEALRNISQNLCRLRGQRTYTELAEAIAMPGQKAFASTVRYIEIEQNMPGAGLLARLAEALGVTTDELLAEPRPTKRARRLVKKGAT